jgi:hypothetical protein
MKANFFLPFITSVSSAEVKGWVELYRYSPNTPSWRGAELKKAAQGQLYLYLCHFSFSL